MRPADGAGSSRAQVRTFSCQKLWGLVGLVGFPALPKNVGQHELKQIRRVSVYDSDVVPPMANHSHVTGVPLFEDRRLQRFNPCNRKPKT